jgi:hypothetical protein
MLDTDNSNHISTVRGHLIAQLAALKAAVPGDTLDAEIKRSKGMSELSQTIINSAKVEVEYLAATGQQSAPFLEVAPDAPHLSGANTHQVKRLPGDSNGITSITQHRLKG